MDTTKNLNLWNCYLEAVPSVHKTRPCNVNESDCEVTGDKID